MDREQPNADIQVSLRKALETLPGVHRAVVDGPPSCIFLICEPQENTSPPEAAARALLAREGVDPTDVELRISYLEKPQPRRRLRFVGVESESPASGRVTVTVTLEWRGALIRGTAEGESSLVGDLRVCAYATLQALTSVLDGGTQFDLVGIKSTRIFDTDLIAVVLDCADVPGRRLIGASLVAVDQKRSAVLSVLHATNRVLGNYLTTSD